MIIFYRLSWLYMVIVFSPIIFYTYGDSSLVNQLSLIHGDSGLLITIEKHGDSGIPISQSSMVIVVYRLSQMNYPFLKPRQ